MSHPSPSATAQPQSLSSASFPPFAELAERMQRLQSAAQDLLAGFAAAEQGPASAPQPAPTTDSKPAAIISRPPQRSRSASF